jgi:hypothetical protein
LRQGFGSTGFGLLSLNVSYHFANRSNPARVVPFVTAGYGLAFRSGTENLFNWRGGMTYWFGRRVGLRVELRDYIWTAHGGHRIDTGIRFGAAFR